MLRIVFAISAVALCHSSALSQTPLNRFEKLIQQTGINLKVDTYGLPDFTLAEKTTAKAKILKVFVEHTTHSFYRLEWGSFHSIISFSELLELQNSLILMKEQSVELLKGVPEYTEAKYTTSDGFEVGFVRSIDKLSWYMSNRSSGSMLFLQSIDVIDKQILSATDRLRQLH